MPTQTTNGEEIPVSWFTVEELLEVERFAKMLAYEASRIAWTYERRAYQYAALENEATNSDDPEWIKRSAAYDWCCRYEALKASRYYELAAVL